MRRLLSAIVVLAVVLVLSACSRPPWEWTGCYYHDAECTELSHDTMSQILDAINAQDAGALKEVFSQRAVTEFSTEIDSGVEHLLAMFPDGDLVWTDPDAEANVGTYSNRYGAHAVWVSSTYRVTSGGSEFKLFFGGWAENEIDPSDAGVTGMGAVPWTGSQDANLNAALRSWNSTLVVAERPTVFRFDDGPTSGNRAAQIVDALNAQDAAALREMFTANARADAAVQLDKGLAYVLSLFPNGDVSVVPDDPIKTIVRGDTGATVLFSFVRIRSGGLDYRLYFAECTENDLDSGDVGLVEIAAAEVGETPQYTPEALIYDWIAFDVDGGLAPGVLVPEDENR